MKEGDRKEVGGRDLDRKTALSLWCKSISMLEVKDVTEKVRR
jgi:hypothetical protein